MKVAIIGAGASGLVCAAEIAAKAKLNKLSVEITLLEGNDKVGKKILATGNGRCNMMNRNEGDFFFDKNGFSSYALKKFNVESNLSFFASHGLYTRTDEEGRIYPLSNQASSVLDCLRFACDGLGVKAVTDYTVNTLKSKNKGFVLNGELVFDRVVLACGGKAGVKSFNGYDLLTQTGHKVNTPCPSLTKLEVSELALVRQLKGVRQKGSFTLYCDNKEIAAESGEILFTDYGISGIAAMQLSAYAARCGGKKRLVADFVKELTFNELTTAIADFAKNANGLKNENLLSGFVSKKLGGVVLKSLGFSLNDYACRLSEKEIKAIAARLKGFEFNISGLKGFNEAQVTAGGADTSAFNRKTMESEKVRGLYCIGELLDVDGLCGGYNLHWAWSSARLCAESIINEISDRKG